MTEQAPDNTLTDKNNSPAPAEQTNQYSIKVPVFEGPLDLLLHLIKHNKIDIYDIPIAQITGQYLEYIEIMKELNLEIASEFLVMAATLIYVKSRMLLPPGETAKRKTRKIRGPALCRNCSIPGV